MVLSCGVGYRFAVRVTEKILFDGRVEGFICFGGGLSRDAGEAMPLYSVDARWSRKAARIVFDVLKVGNFGQKHRRDYSGMSYLKRKCVSSLTRLSDMLRHFPLFPKDSIVFLGGVIRSGVYAAVRGE